MSEMKQSISIFFNSLVYPKKDELYRQFCFILYLFFFILVYTCVNVFESCRCETVGASHLLHRRRSFVRGVAFHRKCSACLFTFFFVEAYQHFLGFFILYRAGVVAIFTVKDVGRVGDGSAAHCLSFLPKKRRLVFAVLLVFFLFFFLFFFDFIPQVQVCRFSFRVAAAAANLGGSC